MGQATSKKTCFIDRVKLFLKAGDGGDGCLSFRREKFIPFGGPDGGNGGNGGDIYLEVDGNLTTLIEVAYHPHVHAELGTHGKGKNMFGKNGDPTTVYVPCGTVVRRDGKIIADMTVPGERFLAAKGGRGGRGNYSFKNRFNTAPKIAERGEKGDDITLQLELKLLADVGLAGFPNAGKSTFLSLISSARPKVADYPFTTLSPNLGVVYHKKKSFVVADIPGLIEGAHEGKGLGYTFLKHIERTRVVVQLIDPQGFCETDALKSVSVIAKELKMFSPKLGEKPRILVVNKADLQQAQTTYAKIAKKYSKQKVFLMSAATGEGSAAVLDEIVRVLNATPVKIDEPQEPKNPIAEHRIEPAFHVVRGDDGILDVSGREIFKLLEKTNFSQPEALIRLKNILKRIGLDKALKKNGVMDGDSVRLCGKEFEWADIDYDLRADIKRARRKQKPS